jgi:predicted secreted protein
VRRAGFGLALLLVAAPVAAETIDVRPDLTFQGSTPYQAAIEAHVGDTIRVDLPAQAGTGYAWTPTLDGDAVQAGRSEKRPAARPGGPEREILSYLAAAPGTARISFVYHRPWETSQGPARQVVVSVAVTEAPVPDPLAPPPQP